MPDTNRQTLAVTYLPSKTTYCYLPQLENNLAYEFKKDANGANQDVAILESHGRDAWYAHKYCDQIIFGSGVNQIDAVFHMRMSNDYGYEVYNSMELNLNKPLATAYANQTLFTGGEEFGQDSTSSVPSKVEIVHTETGTNIVWYYNGAVIVTQTITGFQINSFIICAKESNKIMTNYAFVWSENGTYYASGDMSDANVMQYILRNKGEMIANTERSGWADPDDPDNPDKAFILSELISIPGQYTVLSHGTANNVANGVERLYAKQDELGGFIGTDLVTFITGRSDTASAWDYLMNDPESDMLTYNIPSAEGYDYRIEWHYSDKNFYVYDGETQKAVSINLQSTYKTGGCIIPIGTLDGGTALGWGLAIRTSTPYTCDYHFYFWNSDMSGTETAEFDFEEAYLEDYNGFDDPNQQEDDNPQDDPEDMEDPSVDALSTGFLYAFQVETTDMENLVSCLNGQTLAQKIKADFGNHLFDFIVSYHVMPCITNATELSRVGINYMGVPFIYGENDTQLTLKRITSSFYKVDLNSIRCLPKVKRGNGFENWANAQVQLYLPFIGTVHLNTPDVWGKDVHVVYYFDILAGTCTVNVGAGDHGTLYSFTGSCVYKIPFTSTIDQSMQNMIAGVTSAGSGLISMVSGGVSGNMMSVINGAMGVAGSVGSFVSAMEHKAQINRGGSVGGAGGWHSPRQPALIITVPDVADINKTQYPNMNGYPCHESVILNNYKGKYVEVGQIDLKAQSNSDGAFPNDSELDMIRSALKEGVYV